jgi:hypothetical protein
MLASAPAGTPVLAGAKCLNLAVRGRMLGLVFVYSVARVHERQRASLIRRACLLLRRPSRARLPCPYPTMLVRECGIDLAGGGGHLLARRWPATHRREVTFGRRSDCATARPPAVKRSRPRQRPPGWRSCPTAAASGGADRVELWLLACKRGSAWSTPASLLRLHLAEQAPAAV